MATRIERERRTEAFGCASEVYPRTGFITAGVTAVRYQNRDQQAAVISANPAVAPSGPAGRSPQVTRFAQPRYRL